MAQPIFGFTEPSRDVFLPKLSNEELAALTAAFVVQLETTQVPAERALLRNLEQNARRSGISVDPASVRAQLKNQRASRAFGQAVSLITGRADAVIGQSFSLPYNADWVAAVTDEVRRRVSPGMPWIL